MLAVLWTAGWGQGSSCAFAAFDQAVKQAEVVGLVEIERHVPQAGAGFPGVLDMQVRVLATYVGQPDAQRLTVRGDDGMSPYPYVTQYPVGTRWVLALTRKDWRTGKPMPAGRYSPVACTGLGLLVSGPVAYGVLTRYGQTGPADVLPLKQLPAWIKAMRARR
ncbi:hypothetical protein C8263_04730 [Deinococcus arcticus]|uniref:Uncharacterized protein n=1 Tax=Deinococcus arcticus TaxID=2136176 RepID=A0A2T3WB10_9DEIO|nr:hypothetical protein C8263_04730 [Deinococcus arcticus]